MTDPKRPRQSKGKSAPIFWRAVVAFAALWRRGKAAVFGAPAPSPPLTPAQWEAAEPGRGRSARAPWIIPLLGWKDIVWRAGREVSRARLPFLAGGVTFYVLLAIFPAIAAFVSLYGIFSDLNSVEKQLQQLSALFPRDAVSLIGQQMVRLATQRHETLSAAVAVGALVSIWSANAGINALVNGINIAYGEREKRNYFELTLLTYATTLAATVFLAIAAAITVAAPVFFHDVGLHGLRFWWAPLRWLGVYLIAASGFTLVYRYGPSRARARWRWVVPGGFAAALFWMAASLGFSWYLDNFANFDVTYGSLGAMVGFMVWVWFSVMVVLAGAELNSEIEHQTACDTTTGEPLPMGERDAVMADTVGAAFTVSPRQARDIAAGFLQRFARDVVDWLQGA